MSLDEQAVLGGSEKSEDLEYSKEDLRALPMGSSNRNRETVVIESRERRDSKGSAREFAPKIGGQVPILSRRERLVLKACREGVRREL